MIQNFVMSWDCLCIWYKGILLVDDLLATWTEQEEYHVLGTMLNIFWESLLNCLGINILT